MEPRWYQRRTRKHRSNLGVIVTIKILVSDKIADEGIITLQEQGYEVTRGWDIPKPDLPKIIGEYDVLIVRSATKVRGELLENAKKLRVIGRAGEGLDNVDYERAKKMGITLVNTPHISYISVSELTLGHMIALARNIVPSTLTLREGKWEKDKLMDKLAFPYFLNGVPHDPMINLNKTMFILDKKEERELARRIGYSLYGYEELSYVQERLNKL